MKGFLTLGDMDYSYRGFILNIHPIYEFEHLVFDIRIRSKIYEAHSFQIHYYPGDLMNKELGDMVDDRIGLSEIVIKQLFDRIDRFVDKVIETIENEPGASGRLGNAIKFVIDSFWN